MANIPFAAHESSDGTRLAEVETTQFGSDRARKELGAEGYNAKQDCIPPGFASIQEAQVRFEAGSGEILRKKGKSVYVGNVHHRSGTIEWNTSHTKGRNTIETRSSNFSTNAIAKPLSWGTIKPATNPPKIFGKEVRGEGKSRVMLSETHQRWDECQKCR